MATGRSFAEFIKAKCYNTLYETAEEFVQENQDSLNLYSRKLHKIGDVDLVDATIQRVYVRDLPDMRVAFDVAFEVELELHEADYHYDDMDSCSKWLRICCVGDLACGLDDWTVESVNLYNPQKSSLNSLSDALVPYIPYDQLETVATQFLKEYYPEALKITPIGEPPVWVDPNILTKRLELNVRTQRIREDASIFGQLYFVDTDAEIFDVNAGKNKTVHIDGRTIVVDPAMYLLRNLGSVNNTIIHECVHWVKHRKVFELEKLYNKEASCISCKVVGGAAATIAKKATEQMEKQANQLTPRIQMPAAAFKAKANEYIGKFMKETGAKHKVDVMEMVITELESAFGVSRQAAKIRLVELGFDEAIGTYTFLDNHYVRPHGFRKGSIKVNQTFSVCAQDAALQRFLNPELRKLTEDGDYIFVDNHYVYNAPLYVETNFWGHLTLTDYARSHMDECCLVFDMEVTSKVGAEYHTACFLNREQSDVTFEIKYHNGYQNAPKERQVAMRKKQQEEWLNIRKQMTDDPEQCMDLLFKWKGMSYRDLGLAIDRDPKTISRTVKGTTAPKVETAALICLGMNLPPVISSKLMDVLGCKLKPMDPQHQWINEALNVKYTEPVDDVREYLGMFGVEI